MPAVEKTKLQDEYSELLKESPDFILTRFSGLNVEQMTDLRAKLREKKSGYRVIKNRIFKRSVEQLAEAADFPYDRLAGPIGVAFGGEDITGTAKVLKDFAKEHELFEIMAGVMENNFIEAKEVEAIANLPSKEQLLAQIAAGLNAPTTQIARATQEVMASLARAIKAVGEKNG